MGRFAGILLIILAAVIYSISRIILNKEFDLNLPIFPKRYYDNTRLMVIQAILTMFNFTVAIQILLFVEEYLSSR